MESITLPACDEGMINGGIQTLILIADSRWNSSRILNGRAPRTAPSNGEPG